MATDTQIINTLEDSCASFVIEETRTFINSLLDWYKRTGNLTQPQWAWAERCYNAARRQDWSYTHRSRKRVSNKH